MLYKIFKVIVTFSLKLYFRKIDLSGLPYLSEGKAQILASNHPSGFLEPLIMACFFPRPLYFLVRGDVFENRFLKPVLTGTHQLPIYRFKDGFSKLRENKSSMEAASQVLLDKKCLLIFAEGSTKSIKMVRPLQKGFIRLAADAQSSNPELPIEIVPVGINFSDSTKFAGDVMVRVGKPVLVDSASIISGSESAQYTNYLLQNTYEKLQENVIHLAEQSRLKVMEDVFLLEKIQNSRPLHPKVSHDDTFLQTSKHIAIRMDAMEENTFLELKEELKDFKKELKASNSGLEKLTLKKAGILQYVVFILGLLPAFAGYLLHLMPLGLALFLAKKNATSKEFFGSIRFVLSIVAVFVYYLILISLWATGILPGYFILLCVILGYFARYYYDFWQEFVYWGKPSREAQRLKAVEIYRRYFQTH
ncbi:MAG: 1-acyl-sn-glycerol-3-phosphate acyltransferase [Saprospiraceae bacterium]|nr:1-acyl-sn-glycerol-3-phosphate acyltransferase [Saprospiraceae bacterium]